MVIAVHNAADDGKYPPVAVCDKEGRPLLSWRVLVLPYLEESRLYNEFRLDEPWDSPHNLQLLPRMPRVYAAPGSKARLLPPHHTIIQAIVGPGAAFEEGKRLGYDDFTDGTSNTLFVVEAGDPVPWTKPQDIVYAPDCPVPRLWCIFHDGFRASYADGSSCFIPKDIPAEELRALITRNGGDEARGDF